MLALPPSQPLYTGSTSLVLSGDEDVLADILLFDPCFDYISAGLISAIPISMDEEQQQQISTTQEPYDMVMPAGTMFGAGALAASTAPAKRSPKKSKRTPTASSPAASSARSSAQTSPAKEGGVFSAAMEALRNGGSTAASSSAVHPASDTAETSGGLALSAQVVEGVRQLATPPPMEGERSDDEEAEDDAEYDSEDEEEDEEDEEDEDNDEEEEGEEGEDDENHGEEAAEGDDGQYVQNPYAMRGPYQSLRQQQPAVQYVWNPEAMPFLPGGTAATIDMDGSGLHADGMYYGANNPYAQQQQQRPQRSYSPSRYMSHFSSSSSTHSNGGSARYGSGYMRGNANPHTSSPTLMAQRHDLYFQQDLHLHDPTAFSQQQHSYQQLSYNNNNHNHYNSYNSRPHSSHSQHFSQRTPVRAPQGSMPQRVYERTMLLQLRLQPQCQERPANLPPHLLDIYKPIGGASNSASGRSPPRSGRSLFGNASAAGGVGGGNGRSVFGGLQANMNHSLPGPHDGIDGAQQGGKRGGKPLKSKRKKNKDRSARAIEDDDLAAPRGPPVPSLMRRRGKGGIGADSDADEERKEDTAGGSTVKTMRGLSTPKLKASKQKKGNKGGHTGGKGASGRDGAVGNFQLDSSSQFENATMADLHHCENKWVPSSVSAATLLAGEDSVRSVQKSARAILNKLSIDKLGVLLESMASLPLDSADALQALVDVLFDKSVDEPEFAGLYARFCAELAPRMPEFTVHTGAAPAGEGGLSGQSSSKTYSFRTLLLTRCYRLLVEDEESLRASLYATALAAHKAKHEFSLNGNGSGSVTGSPRLGPVSAVIGSGSRTSSPQRSSSPLLHPLTYSPRSLSPRLLPASTSPRIGASASPLELPLVTSLELEEKLRVLRGHQRGNLTFIGELFKQRMLPHSVVHLCLDALLDDATSTLDPAELAEGHAAPLEDEPDEDDVEAVCTFMQCVGAKLEAAAQGHDEDDEAAAQADAEGGWEAVAALRATRRGLLDGHFRKILALSRCPTLASRFRFMLQDLLDLRARHWVPRMKKTVDPKSLTEIREENSALLTPQPHHHHQPKNQWGQGPLTSARKPMGKVGGGGAPYGVGGMAHTTVRPQQHRAAAGPVVGRVLHFGSEGSPLMKRSASAPDIKDNEHEHPPSRMMMAELPPVAEGRYVPMWQRRKLGMGDGFHALLPRSTAADSATQTVSDGNAAGAAAADALQNQADATAEAASALSEEELSHQLSTLLDELYSAHDVSEALQCLSEVLPHAASPLAMQRALVPLLLSKCVEQRSAEARALAPALLLRALPPSSASGVDGEQQQQSHHQGLLSAAGLEAGLRDWLALLADVAIDTPHAPAYSAAVIAQLLQHRPSELSVAQLLRLHAEAASDGSVARVDAASWALETLAQLRALVCTGNDAAAEEGQLSSLLRPSPSSSPQDGSSATSAAPAEAAAPASGLGLAALLFDGDEKAARAAIDKHQLSSVAHLLL
jgi:hypothetical protein